jgi:hypothetical protein
MDAKQLAGIIIQSKISPPPSCIHRPPLTPPSQGTPTKVTCDFIMYYLPFLKGTNKRIYDDAFSSIETSEGSYDSLFGETKSTKSPIKKQKKVSHQIKEL